MTVAVVAARSLFPELLPILPLLEVIDLEALCETDCDLDFDFDLLLLNDFEVDDLRCRVPRDDLRR